MELMVLTCVRMMDDGDQDGFAGSFTKVVVTLNVDFLLLQMVMRHEQTEWTG